MKVLALGASNSKTSINKTLASYAAALLDDVGVEILDINDYAMPLFGVDIEAEIGQHPLAEKFLGKIAAADAIIISFAEHNGSYTAAYKNLFDWASRIDRKVFQGKPALWLATSPGSGGARNLLSLAVNSAPHFGAELVGSLSVPSFYDSFNTEAGKLVNPELQMKLEGLLDRLLASVKARRDTQTRVLENA